jgi:threonine aldolase
MSMRYGEIDLRSDTVTRPTPGMRRAIAEAEVGDDMTGDDPTVNRLEARMAELLSKEAAIFASSGTQSNQMGVRAHCFPGDELLIHETNHIGLYEAGAPAALSGVTVKPLRGEHGMLDLPDLAGKISPDDQHFCVSKLLCVENTTNRGGGIAWPLEQMARVAQWAHQHNLKVHLDGARLFNAATVKGYSVTEFARHADTISICFSKGLGCPMGSILAGDKPTIAKARRIRKLFGGALRQAGMMAAAAIYALDHHVERLREDHDNARIFAEAIAEIPGIKMPLDSLQTNLVFFEVAPEYGPAANLTAGLLEHKVRMLPVGPQRVRACTHLDVDKTDVLQAADAIRTVMRELAVRPKGQKVAVPAGAYGGR